VLSSFLCCFSGVNFKKRNQDDDDDDHYHSEGGHDDNEEEQKALLDSVRTPLHLLAYQNTM
jgi:hypothetical protein